MNATPTPQLIETDLKSVINSDNENMNASRASTMIHNSMKEDLKTT
jgi:hypothetical protein